MNDKPTLKLRDVRRRFDRAAAEFDSADFIHTVTRDGLLDRMQPLAIKPASILDLGAATGTAAARLDKRYRGAHLVSLDLSHSMLRQARRKPRWLGRRRASYLQAEASQLPFPDQSIDMVFSNLLLPFIDSPETVFTEVSRVLRKDGVFAFATLGPDSLQELREAWRHVDHGVHVSEFPDMHDIGDALVRAGLRDPVLDVDRLHVQYQDPGRLFADLASVGARNTFAQRSRALMGKRRFANMQAALTGASIDGKIGLELELVYGHCWGGGPRKDPANFTIDASRIQRRRSQ